jgi:hypothetical protein
MSAEEISSQREHPIHSFVRSSLVAPKDVQLQHCGA